MGVDTCKCICVVKVITHTVVYRGGKIHTGMRCVGMVITATA